MDLDDIISKLLELKAQGVSRVYLRTLRQYTRASKPIKFDRDKNGDGIIIGD